MLIERESLTELLKVGIERVRRVISQLAFEAHAAQTDDRRTADIAEGDLVNALLNASPDRDLRPKRLLEHLSDRAGLLVPRGVKVYTFPHRTFQEYLAACHIADHDDYPHNIAELAVAEPNRWREAALLSAAKAMRGSAKILWDFVDAFLEQENPYAALFAAQAVAENADLKQISDRSRKKVERLKEWLTAMLTEYTAESCLDVKLWQGCEPLPAVERALAGNLLAVFGDNRPGVGVRADGLPDIEWIEIPAGAFMMGSDKTLDKDAYGDEQPRHRVTFRQPFQISRYPITNAQYEAFVKAGGYDDETYWKAGGGWKYKEQGKWNGPRQFSDARFGLDNHPVVGVSWYEAMAFCAWLTATVGAGSEPAPTTYRLPTEAEWEYAARGQGEAYRRYPWGDEMTPEHANYRDTKIGATNAVGGFPRGKSAFGCEEMAGNVWEWCLDSSLDNYRNAPDDGNMQGNMGDEKAKVLRGGSWILDPSSCRCAVRHRNNPADRNLNGGFRVVVGVAWT